MKVFSLFLSLLLFTTFSCQQEQQLIDQLQEQNKVENDYHFYPSTLRMFNLNDDPDFNQLFKKVDKITFYNMRTDSFDLDQLHDFSTSLQSEGYEIYVEMENELRQFTLLGKTSPENKSIALISFEERFYLLDILGELNLLKIPGIMQKMTEQDSTSQNGFTMLFDLIKQDASHEEIRRERRKRRAAERKLKEAEQKGQQSGTDSAHQDVITTDSISNNHKNSD